MIPIDEQIEHQRGVCNGTNSEYENAKLASLQRLKAIDAVQVPEQPREGGVGVFSEFIVSKQTQEYIDTLRDLLKRTEEKRSKALKVAAMYARRMMDFEDRAEAAEAKLAAIKEQS